MITFILPIGSEMDFKLSFELLIPSFMQYKQNLDYKFFILYKSDHQYIIDYYYNNSSYDFEDFEFVDEDNIYDSSNITNTYYLQMLLKLMVAKIIKTDFYVTLDSDVIFTNNFDINSFTNNDKAYYYLVKKLDTWGKRVNKELDMNLEDSFNQTPFIFKTKLVLDMIEEFDLPDLILNKLCSEYTLFYAFLKKHNLLDKHYVSKRFRTVGINSNIIKDKKNPEIIELFHKYAKINKMLVVQSRINKHVVLKDEFKKYIKDCVFGEKKILIASIVGGREYIKRYQKSLHLKTIYCKKQMYDFSLEMKMDKLDGWAKVEKMIKLMENKKYDYIFMSDTDVTITNMDIRIENIIMKYYDSKAIMYITTDMNSLNSGNVIWKCCDDSLLFLKEMYKLKDNKIRYSIREPFFPKGIYEQPSLIYLYNKFPEWREKIRIIPQFEINSYSEYLVNEGNVLPIIDNIENRSLWKEGDFLVHYAGANYKQGFENEKFDNNINNMIMFYLKKHIKLKEGFDTGLIK